MQCMFYEFFLQIPQQVLIRTWPSYSEGGVTHPVLCKSVLLLSLFQFVDSFFSILDLNPSLGPAPRLVLILSLELISLPHWAQPISPLINRMAGWARTWGLCWETTGWDKCPWHLEGGVVVTVPNLQMETWGLERCKYSQEGVWQHRLRLACTWSQLFAVSGAPIRWKELEMMSSCTLLTSEQAQKKWSAFPFNSRGSPLTQWQAGNASEETHTLAFTTEVGGGRTITKLLLGGRPQAPREACHHPVFRWLKCRNVLDIWGRGSDWWQPADALWQCVYSFASIRQLKLPDKARGIFVKFLKRLETEI